MKMKTQLCGLAVLGALVCASSEEFPLEFKLLDANEAMNLPGDYGLYGNVQLASPRPIKKEPKLVCRRPVYGQLGDQGMLFRLEESKGDGKGYDRLIVDANKNDDLTDDPVMNLASGGGASLPGMSQLLFGPLEIEIAQLRAGLKPRYFAEAILYREQPAAAGHGADIIVVQVRLRPGWLLHGTVQVAGRKEKVALVDANASLRLGDPPRWRTFDNDGEPSWVPGPADTFLRLSAGSAPFSRYLPESLAPVHYFGSEPCQVSLGAEGKTLRVEPFSGLVGELAFESQAGTVSSIRLAWEQSPGQWYLLSPMVAGGKAKVPSGNYRLYSCQLDAKAADGQRLQLVAYKRTVKPSLEVATAARALLRCGAPMQVKVTAQKRGTDQLDINSVVVGAGGETYVRFAKGDDLQGEPPKPVFTIVDDSGKQVASGNLECG